MYSQTEHIYTINLAQRVSKNLLLVANKMHLHNPKIKYVHLYKYILHNNIYEYIL